MRKALKRARRSGGTGLARGEAAAFELLFTQHYGQVYRVAYNLVGTREAAEDLAQETFLALYREPPPAGAPLLAWLCRVALNRGYNSLRGQRRMPLGQVLRAGDGAVGDHDAAGLLRDQRAQHPGRCAAGADQQQVLAGQEIYHRDGHCMTCHRGKAEPDAK